MDEVGQRAADQRPRFQTEQGAHRGRGIDALFAVEIDQKDRVCHVLDERLEQVGLDESLFER